MRRRRGRRRAGPATARLAAAIETFARRALRARRQAWALLAEPVDPAVEAERLVFRRAHAAHFAAILATGSPRGELPDAGRRRSSAAALVGALGEALVGPLSPVAPRARPRRARRHARRVLPALRHRPRGPPRCPRSPVAPPPPPTRSRTSRRR